AAPLLTRFGLNQYALNCTGNPGTEDKLALRDGSAHPLSGREQVDALRAAAASTQPLTITDKFGTNTAAVIETLEVYEEHASLSDPSKAGSFTVGLKIRGV